MATITQISSATDLSSLLGTKIQSSSSGTDTSSTDGAAKKAEDLKNQFLSILLTQMQHQNPLDPMDTKEFTGQLAQFSSLEQQISTNVKLDGLLSSLQQSTAASSFGYIGQYVDLNTPTSSMQDGMANWTYALPDDAQSVTITLKDGSGNVVYTGTMQNQSGSTEMNSGTYSFGITNADLTEPVPDGTVLTMSISANDVNNQPITTDIHTTVKVDSIQSDSNATYLQAGGILFEISDVQKIVNAPNTTPTA